ncbi:MAG TPA: N-acetyltransferase [Caulobacteraceae bacterium]|nr:N-acetyltransferase [Caulobacteraceae bacterium]
MVRPPKARDFQAIHDVETAAFGREAEAEIARRVREEGEALVELVFEEAGEITGHILFSRTTTDPADRRIAALGPVAVRPDAQGRGVGEALCDAGIEAVKALGAEAVVVLGHATYYPRFGFSHAAVASIASPYADLPAFMALELVPGALATPVKVAYPRAFG